MAWWFVKAICGCWFWGFRLFWGVGFVIRRFWVLGGFGNFLA